MGPLAIGVLALAVVASYSIRSAGRALQQVAGIGASEWSSTRNITSQDGIPFKMRIDLIRLTTEPETEYCAPTTSPGTANALIEIKWTNDSDRSATVPATSLAMNAAADPGSSVFAGSFNFKSCGLGPPATPLEPGQSVTIKGAFPGVPETGVSGFYLFTYGSDGGLYGEPLDSVLIEAGESDDASLAADTIRQCAAEISRIEAALKQWSSDVKGQYSGPVSIEELIPKYLSEAPTMFEYTPGGYPSDVARGVVVYGTISANEPCTGESVIYFVYGG